jgi:hypothetical protein
MWAVLLLDSQQRATHVGGGGQHFSEPIIVADIRDGISRAIHKHRAVLGKWSLPNAFKLLQPRFAHRVLQRPIVYPIRSPTKNIATPHVCESSQMVMVSKIPFPQLP